MTTLISENPRRNVSTISASARQSGSVSISPNSSVTVLVPGLREASQAEAIAGTILGKYMSPLRVRQALVDYITSIDLRTRLTANTTFYWGTGGSDSNDGLTSGNRFETPQGAIDAIFNTYDFNGKAVRLEATANATYAGISLTQGWTGGGSFTIGVGGGLTSVVLSGASNAVLIDAALPGPLGLEGMGLTSSGGNGINVSKPCLVTHTGMTFGACANAHMIAAQAGAKIEATGNYTISGNASFHMWASDFGTVAVASRTVTLSSSPSFIVFAYNPRGGMILANANTYSGSLGVALNNIRYYVDGNGVIYTGGGGANYFPGTAAGSTANGGIYL
jgi:hypothetical protein